MQLTRLRELMAGGAVWRMRDLTRQGVAAATVRRALAAGLVEQVSRGTYRENGAPLVPGAHLAEAIARVPRGVVCLHSAAALHGLGDVVPPRVWIGVPNAYKPPAIEWPPVRYVRWRRAAAFSVGISERTTCGVRVRMTDPARTVVDLLLMREAAGEERGLECFRDFLAQGGAPADLARVADGLGVGSRLAPLIRAATILGRAA